jgi:hypothetical protein
MHESKILRPKPDKKIIFPATRDELAFLRDHHRTLADELARGNFHHAAASLRERADKIANAIADAERAE